MFFYLPFEHSENLGDQILAVKLCKRLVEMRLGSRKFILKLLNDLAGSHTVILFSDAGRRQKSKHSSTAAVLLAEGDCPLDWHPPF